MIAALSAWLACSGAPACDETWTLDDTPVACARVASGSAALRQGLRGAPPLQGDQGLRLAYPVESTACLTMEGVDQPLDALFLAPSGRVVQAACGLAPGDPTPRCVGGVRDVLERSPHPDCPTWAGEFVVRQGAPAPPEAAWIPPVTLEGPRCAASEPTGELGGALQLEVVVDASLSRETASRVLGAAEVWWRDQGLQLRLVGEPRVAELGPLMEGTRKAYRERLQARGLPLEGGTEAEVAAARVELVDHVMGPLRERLAAEALPVREHTAVVVILPEIARPGSMAEALFERLRGLTFSPWLRERLGPEEQALYGLLGLPERFTPVVFVGTEPIRELGPEAVDVTLAHELGHALGLPHVDAADDVMADRIHRCIPALTASEASSALGYRRFDR